MTTRRNYATISMPVDQDAWIFDCDAVIEEQRYAIKYYGDFTAERPAEMLVCALRNLADYIEYSRKDCDNGESDN